MYTVTLLMGVISFLLCVLLAERMSNSLTFPIKRMNDAMHKVLEGHLETRIPVDRQDELGQMSENFNIMANKLSEQIYGSILKDIVSGVYAPREFISEAQIAAKYGVSKAPVKEAMHILASEGFLLSYPKRGYMVNVYTTEEINNIQEVRRALETLAMRKAIVTATDEELNALRFYQENEELQCRPGETVNTRFHMGIARLAKNKALEETLYPLLVKASSYNIMGDPDIQNFDHIVDAMLARDEELAVKCLLEDVRFL